MSDCPEPEDQDATFFDDEEGWSVATKGYQERVADGLKPFAWLRLKAWREDFMMLWNAIKYGGGY